ncbi:MAG: tRNA wybutosine-synthesizing [Lasallia pustulata]|uniref:tRNA(Phe) (4-demethylwyosine(37)-C(7)) aminocarboxypropyltransferase n=1 Tax=Lasallia pustulata TaxID=136370 RepID=A0A5M8PFT4_9LECA|nr:MAG: tRNA wybutosine-synthesizing [Lasallia pustulata]
MADSSIVLLVPTHLTKSLKDSLERRGKLDKSTKIRPVTSEEDLQGIELGYGDRKKSCIGKVIIPTTMTWAPDSSDPLLASAKIFALLQIDVMHAPEAANITPALRRASPPAPAPKSPLAQVTLEWLSGPPVSRSLRPPTQLSLLCATTSWGYTIHAPMLLLPHSPPWPTLLATFPPPQLSTLYLRLCTTFRVTHIALSGPIPLHSTSPRRRNPTTHHPCPQKQHPPPRPQPPTSSAPHLPHPLHGAFGPSSPHPPPTRHDLSSAFWCRAQQNGIHQVWAPRYTMFSRGNIREKARILALRFPAHEAAGGEVGNVGVAEAAAERGWSAVDLYAGIGYFAFSYVRRGAAVVLCWEINPWSVEGLRRGCRANGWGEATVVERGGGGDGAGMGKLVVYAEDNRFAAERVEKLRAAIPPVRHVNCGFLPTSYPSWRIAVRVLDPSDGGWIHVHENIAVTDIAKRAEEMVDLIASYVAETPRSSAEQWTVSCQHIERVKSYAPGVLHCVVDISIMPPPLPPPPSQATPPATSSPQR